MACRTKRLGLFLRSLLLLLLLEDDEDCRRVRIRAATAWDRGLTLLLLPLGLVVVAVVAARGVEKSIIPPPRFSCIRKATREPRFRRRSRMRSWAILPMLKSWLVVLWWLDEGGEAGVRGDKERIICDRGVPDGVLGEEGVVGLILSNSVGERKEAGGDRCRGRGPLALLRLRLILLAGDEERPALLVAALGVVGGVEPMDDEVGDLGLAGGGFLFLLFFFLDVEDGGR
jgi:hypothetical protein